MCKIVEAALLFSFFFNGFIFLEFSSSSPSVEKVKDGIT